MIDLSPAMYPSVQCTYTNYHSWYICLYIFLLFFLYTLYLHSLISIRVCLCAKLQGVQHARGRQAKFSQLASEQQASLERFPLCSRTMDGWNYCECGPSISQFSAAFIPPSLARRNWTNVPLYHSLYLSLYFFFQRTLIYQTVWISSDFAYYLRWSLPSFLFFTGSIIVFFKCLETSIIFSSQFLFRLSDFKFLYLFIIFFLFKWVMFIWNETIYSHRN